MEVGLPNHIGYGFLAPNSIMALHLDLLGPWLHEYSLNCNGFSGAFLKLADAKTAFKRLADSSVAVLCRTRRAIEPFVYQMWKYQV